MTYKTYLLNVIFLISLTFSVNCLAESKLIWLDNLNTDISSSNLDGSDQSSIYTGVPDGFLLLDFAYDSSNGKLYKLSSTKLSRSNVDNSEPEIIFTSQSTFLRDFALDLINNKIYFISATTIYRANLDGSSLEQVVVNNLASFRSIALDIGNQKIYWTDATSDIIGRLNYNGTGGEDLVTTGLNFPRAIILDSVNGKMYWSDSGTDKIQRANLDGSSVQDLVNVNNVESVGVDTVNNKIIWYDEVLFEIRTANLDGTGPATFLNNLLTTNLVYFNNTQEIVYFDIDSGDGLRRATAYVTPSSFFMDLSTNNIEKLSYDPTEDRVYFIDTESDKVISIGSDSFDLDSLLAGQLTELTAIDIDYLNRKLYFADAGIIYSVNLDGSGKISVISGLGLITELKLDLVNDKIYWLDDTNAEIKRANLDGSSQQDIITTGLNNTDSFNLDPANSRIFTIDTTADEIKSFNLTGSGEQLVYAPVYSLSTGIGVDPFNQKLYISNTNDDQIESINYDGTSPIVITDVNLIAQNSFTLIFDFDNDDVDDLIDNCTNVANANQQDSDLDGFGNACDECANDANKTSAGLCGCGVADTDSDSDGTLDCSDSCPANTNLTAPVIDEELQESLRTRIRRIKNKIRAILASNLDPATKDQLIRKKKKKQKQLRQQLDAIVATC